MGPRALAGAIALWILTVAAVLAIGVLALRALQAGGLGVVVALLLVLLGSSIVRSTSTTTRRRADGPAGPRGSVAER